MKYIKTTYNTVIYKIDKGGTILEPFRYYKRYDQWFSIKAKYTTVTIRTLERKGLLEWRQVP